MRGLYNRIIEKIGKLHNSIQKRIIELETELKNA